MTDKIDKNLTGCLFVIAVFGAIVVGAGFVAFCDWAWKAWLAGLVA